MVPYRWHSKVVMLAIIHISTVLLLSGCGSSGDATATTTAPTTATMTSTATTTTTPHAPHDLPYSCKTNLWLDGNVKNIAIKGMAVDDTTMSQCADKLMGVWPNTHSELVKSLRLFAAWKSQWGDDSKREQTWTQLLNFVKSNDIKVFLGVDTTADGFANGENDKQWNWGLDLMAKLGKDRVMGFSFGNEMLNKNGLNWDGTVWPWVKSKISEMDAAGFDDVKVTFVWSMAIMGNMGSNFPFLKTMYQAYTKRWVWVVNPYSIWDRNLYPTSTSDCQAKTDAAVDIVYLKNVMTAFRKKVSEFTGNTDDPLWIGETGWSSPLSASQSRFSFCPAWGSHDALKKYYKNFLDWDGSLNDGVKSPDHFFYFTYRDSHNFGDAQPFGLVDTCSDPNCKLQAQENKTHNVVV